MKKTRTADDEDKKRYMSMKNKNIIYLRINANEKTLLETMMRDEKWTNLSAFVRYKLFGEDAEMRVEKLIEKKEPEDLAILLRNSVLELAQYFLYSYSRYEKDMAQLWKEEGVNMNAWTSATNKWHRNLVKKTENYFDLLRKIASELGLNNYFILPSDSMNPGWDASKEELDKVAEQLRLERIAMGRTDNM